MSSFIKMQPLSRNISYIGLKESDLVGGSFTATSNGMGLRIRCKVEGGVKPVKPKGVPGKIEEATSDTPSAKTSLRLELPVEVDVRRYEAILSLAPELLSLCTVQAIPTVLPVGYRGTLPLNVQLLPGVSTKELETLDCHLYLYLVD